MTRYSTECIFFTKGASCRNGEKCKFKHVYYEVNQIKCPEYWSCTFGICRCRHPTEQEKIEHELNQTNAEKALQSREQREKADFKRRVKHTQSAIEQARANRKIKAKYLVDNLEGWIAYADQEIAEWQKPNATKLYEELIVQSSHFADAVNTGGSFEELASTKRRKLNDGGAACKTVTLDSNLELIKMVWIDILLNKGLWNGDLKDGGVTSVVQFEKTKPWDAENQDFIDTFRNLLKVLHTHSDLAKIETRTLVHWLGDTLGIFTPHVIAGALFHCFSTAPATGKPLIIECLRKSQSTNITPAHWRIITTTFTPVEIIELLTEYHYEGACEPSIELLLGMKTDQIHPFFHGYLFNDLGDGGNHFEDFERSYGFLLSTLLPVQDTPLFDRIYAAVMDNAFSLNHYKVAMKSMAMDDFKPKNNLKWRFSRFNGRLKDDYTHWKVFNGSAHKRAHGKGCYSGAESDNGGSWGCRCNRCVW